MEHDTKAQVMDYARAVYNKGDVVEWRAIGGKRVVSGWTAAELMCAQIPAWLLHNESGLNIYIGANPRIELGKTGDTNVAKCRTLFVDFDHLEGEPGFSHDEIACERIEHSGLPTPTMRIFSGHGIHAYWRLLAPVKPDEWTISQSRMIATLNTDRVIKNPERIMRLPGFDNRKTEPAVPCFIIDCEKGRVYDLSDLMDHCTESTLPPAEPGPALPRSPIMEAKARAMLYAAKWPGCAEGERNNAAYVHSCTLVNDFGLDDADALEILGQWNTVNSPPLDADELRQTFESAKKGAKHPKGCKLTAPRTAKVAKPATQVAPPTPLPRTKPSELVGMSIEDIISGRRRTIEWPWPSLGQYTEALVNGTVTAVCGSKGATKTFFILQSMDHWLEQGERVAMLVMEEDSEHCLRRCLAQRSGFSGITQSRWVQEHPEEARRALSDHAKALDRLGNHLYDLPDRDITLPEIQQWVKLRVDDGHRIIVVDPITAAVQTSEPWKHDARFINGVKRIARDAGVSIILTTHPKKGGSHLIDMDSLAGSAAYIRFAQTILWLDAHDDKEVTIMTGVGRFVEVINRTIHILAARNAAGRNRRIGYWFNNESLTFKEVGPIIKEKRNE